MKKYKIARFFAVFFVAAFLITFRYFDKEAAGMFILFALVAAIAGFIYFKLDRQCHEKEKAQQLTKTGLKSQR